MRQHNSTFFSYLENAIKLTAVIAAVATALGFPAVYLNMSRYGVPSNLITYDQLFKAGLLPALLLVIVAWYCYSAAEFFKKSVHARGWIVRVFMLPDGWDMHYLMGMILVLDVIGFSLITGLFFYIGRGILSLISIITPINISDRVMMIIAGTIVLACMIIFTIVLLIGERREKGRASRFAKYFLDEYPQQIARLGELASEKKPLPKTEEEEQQEFLRKESQWKKWRRRMIVFSILGIGGGLYLTKMILNIAYPDLSLYFTYTNIGLVAVGYGVLFWAFETTVMSRRWLSRKDKSSRLKATLALGTVIVLLYIGSVGIYSYLLYPYLPAGIGGGAPTPITLWFNKTVPLDDIKTALPNIKFVLDGELLRTEGVAILQTSSEYMLIIDNNKPAGGIAVKRERVAAMSWL